MADSKDNSESGPGFFVCLIADFVSQGVTRKQNKITSRLGSGVREFKPAKLVNSTTAVHPAQISLEFQPKSESSGMNSAQKTVLPLIVSSKTHKNSITSRPTFNVTQVSLRRYLRVEVPFDEHTGKYDPQEVAELIYSFGRYAKNRKSMP
ncbi:hypothetical protein EBR21_04250 [bacterium]|nr:hypothetical protein [bacterium]